MTVRDACLISFVLFTLAVPGFLPPSVPGAVQEQTGSEPGASFWLGRYPDRETFQLLKAQGYTAVVSLLHPTAVPRELALLAKQRELAEEFGIEIIHIPLVPRMTDQEKSLNELRELARWGKGRYYVHCYLGKDRVYVAGRVLEAAGARVEVENLDRPRDLGQQAAFERGESIVVDKDVYLTSLPTEEEFFGFVLAGPIKQVVSVWDSQKGTIKALADWERNLLAQYDMPLVELPIAADDYDPWRALEVARHVRALPRPVVVHALWTNFSRSPEAEAFVQAYGSDLPPLPPSLFELPMKQGKVEVIATNVAVGPRPMPGEFRDYLYKKGVRQLVFLGPAESKAAHQDRPRAQEAGLRWRREESHCPTIMETTRRGGPWYLYGPELEQIRNHLVTESETCVSSGNPHPALR